MDKKAGRRIAIMALLASCALALSAAAAESPAPPVYNACPSDKVWSDVVSGCICAPGRSWSDKTKSCVVDCPKGVASCAPPSPPAPPPPSSSSPPAKAPSDAGPPPKTRTDTDASTCPAGKEWKVAFGGCVPICGRDEVLDFHGSACHPIKVDRRSR